MQNYEKLTNPDYLFCELPIKDGSLQDERAWIYCSKHLSLIEVWSYEVGPAAWPKEQFQKQYQYGDEEFLLVFVQNNVDLVNEAADPMLGESVKTEIQVMDEAWEFFKNYLQWEDKQI